MTGRYPQRSGVDLVYFPKSETGLPPSETTIAEVLRERGYATACVGKWHLGHLPEFLPANQGFDYYYGIPYSNDMDMSGFPPIPLMRNGEIIEQPAVQETLTERYTDETIKFIDAHKDKPFFVYLPHTMPHVPLYVSAAWQGKSAGGLYGDVIEEMDANVGRILDYLRENNLAENTFVFFTSDNGPWLTKGEHGGSAGPLRDGKQTAFEGGMRVPGIAWWPGKISPRVVDAMSMNIDLFPTLAALAGAAESPRPLDGRDMRGALLGDAPTINNDLFYFVQDRLVAHRSGPWKLVRTGARHTTGPPLGEKPGLFDLGTDPGEATNLLDSQPEIAARLEAAMKAIASGIDVDRAALGVPPLPQPAK